MKPDWKDAPEWAEWLAMDGNGAWVWHATEPFFDIGDGCWYGRDEEDECAQIAKGDVDPCAGDWEYASNSLEYRS